MNTNKLKTTIQGLIKLKQAEHNSFYDEATFIEGEIHAYHKILKLLKGESNGCI